MQQLLGDLAVHHKSTASRRMSSSILGVQAAPRHEVDLAIQYLFKERLEAREREPTRARRCFDQEVDVGVGSSLTAGDRSEDSQLGVAVFSSQSPKNRPSGIKQSLGMDLAEPGRELELLTHCWLTDPERFGDLALAHPSGKHGPQCDSTPKPRGVFIAPSVLILRQEGHKTILSGPRGSLSESKGRRGRLEKQRESARAKFNSRLNWLKMEAPHEHERRLRSPA